MTDQNVIGFLARAFEETRPLYEEMASISDRVAAIATAAYVDDILGVSISHRFVPMRTDFRERLFHSPSAPLGTFSGKIRIGYALGIYGPNTRADLDIIRNVRNAFAHTAKPISFNDEVISQKCQKLWTADHLTPGFGTFSPWAAEPISAKVRYIRTAQHISAVLGYLNFTAEPQHPQPPDELP